MTTALEWLNSIENQHGVLTPELVLKTAKPVSSPFHSVFYSETDAEAAHAYRLSKAQKFIVSVKVVVVPKGSHGAEVLTRAFHLPDQEAKEGRYSNIDVLMQDHPGILLERALKEWRYMRRRYGDIPGFLEAVQEDISALSVKV